MLDANLQKAIEDCLQTNFGNHLRVKNFHPVGGGCINNGGKLSTNDGNYFVKYNDNRFEGMFETEAKGLELLRNTDAIHVPNVVGYGKTQDNRIFLILEWTDNGRHSRQFWENFATALAELHRNTRSTFGLDFDNYIGSLPQYNESHINWVDFFIEQRIEPQIAIGQKAGQLPEATIDQLRNCYTHFRDLFPEEQPALLHGDLWGGNYMVNGAGNPSLIDPAVYYGHREMELAFTQMFGGFSSTFYQAYHQDFPLSPGFDERKDVYNLYPLLVHVNLFGGGYLMELESIIRRFQ
ncbi:MAG: ketosamine-3-kinase [Bacteroidetes bacterium SW_10_40_5]|nr:MAG: ketosamine-3-kinase [Bacteroidetes bacterium SW_10_40_5]